MLEEMALPKEVDEELDRLEVVKEEELEKLAVVDEEVNVLKVLADDEVADSELLVDKEATEPHWYTRQMLTTFSKEGANNLQSR